MSQTQNPLPATKVSETVKPITQKLALVKMSFYTTYVLLLTTATITFIEALATPNPLIRHVMNLETCISIIAGYFYSQFTNKISVEKDSINYKELNETRYNDWFITTPLMILVIMLSLSYTTKSNVKLYQFVVAVLLNFGMLYSGYLGELNITSKLTATVLGFLFFFALFALIYLYFVRGSKSTFNYVLFTVYAVIWGIYGIVYLLDDEETKNIIYNALDLSAKCLVGLGLWAYFTRIIVS